MSQQADQPSNDKAPTDGITIRGQFTERLPRLEKNSGEVSVPDIRLDHERGAINPNFALLLGGIGYAVINFFTLLLLVRPAIDLDPFSVLSFFAFIAPPAASGTVLFAHFLLKKGFHPLALAGFLALMLWAAIINFQFLAQAAAAV